MIKKATSLLLALCIMIALAVTGFCASGINEAERSILDKIHDSSFITSKNPSLKDSYVNTLSNYFNRDEVEITPEQAEKINQTIQNYNQISMNEKKTLDTYDWETIPDTMKDTLINNMIDIFLELGLKYTYDNGQQIFIVSDSDGKMIFCQHYKDIIVNAGEVQNNSYAVYIAAAAASLAALSVIILLVKVRRKNEF